MPIFMMIGMNPKDIWEAIPQLPDIALSINYNRSKTKGRRVDAQKIELESLKEECRLLRLTIEANENTNINDILHLN